eukprot:4119871-Karenia_brevis.AAC.1
MPIHKGMYIYLTRNVHKDKDYVNGMRCTVQDYDATNQAVIALTETDKVITVVLEYDDKLDMWYYPIRP